MLHFPSAALVTEGERGATANSENLCDRICSRKAGGGLRGFNVLNNDRDEMGLGGGVWVARRRCALTAARGPVPGARSRGEGSQGGRRPARCPLFWISC